MEVGIGTVYNYRELHITYPTVWRLYIAGPAGRLQVDSVDSVDYETRVGVLECLSR